MSFYELFVGDCSKHFIYVYSFTNLKKFNVEYISYYGCVFIIILNIWIFIKNKLKAQHLYNLSHLPTCSREGTISLGGEGANLTGRVSAGMTDADRPSAQRPENTVPQWPLPLWSVSQRRTSFSGLCFFAHWATLLSQVLSERCWRRAEGGKKASCSRPGLSVSHGEAGSRLLPTQPAPNPGPGHQIRDS